MATTKATITNGLVYPKSRGSQRYEMTRHIKEVLIMEFRTFRSTYLIIKNLTQTGLIVRDIMLPRSQEKHLKDNIFTHQGGLNRD